MGGWGIFRGIRPEKCPLEKLPAPGGGGIPLPD